MTRIIAVVAAVAIVALIGATWYVSRSETDAFADCRASVVGSGTSTIGGPFELVDEDGQTVTDQDVFTKPTLLYFGYTFCPDVCPLDNARNAEALDLVQERGYDAQMAFISIDPDRDTPEQLKDFTSFLHDDMIGLTGSPEQVKAASQAYKTYYKKQDEGDDEYYLVDHSTFTYLVLPETGFVEFFKRDDSPEKIAESMSCFIDASS
ncbi:protein SCO1/2 [Maritimibacter alkaliphilus HTCC2654]|jgi:protein SCO1/2|uniref:Regulatory protein SenC n=1 Tax=Maritimibacter alkaliphilus HTCC2654 TaxID=314271 RepID=A3VGE2_9RHOB|nr:MULTISPECIES: SCO family protein [Maritimibacter]EAQ12347.1 regulatory protein SenC [Rhodobacterales bacterium HTCC2654] [Maritimibacter alkaliphilus HTCC2654]MBL6427995.1 SCO family protein [Maritimibacter sp.]TYP84323.1 protein SCO1/2 [Maritimibacter alkaliphilus HTCC2654]